MKYKVVLVDDHVLISKAVGAIINTFPNFEVMFEAENGEVLISKLKVSAQKPDVILLDISMPVMNGFDTALWLKENHPNILVMALSVQDDETSLIKMVRHGAKGYLLKNVHPNDLELALNALVSKGIYFPEWATSKVMQTLTSPNLNGIEKASVTEREKEFLSYVCTELTYKEIGEKMYCSPRTVEGYRDALFEKFNIHTRVGLAMLAIRMGYGKI